MIGETAMLSENERRVMALIGKSGNYDYALPDDDATFVALESLFEKGLIASGPSRIGDFFCWTKSGRAAYSSSTSDSKEKP